MLTGQSGSTFAVTAMADQAQLLLA